MNLNQEGAHTATLEGKMSKKMLHQATGHAGHQFMADTATYYTATETYPKFVFFT